MSCFSLLGTWHCLSWDTKKWIIIFPSEVTLDKVYLGISWPNFCFLAFHFPLGWLSVCVEDRSHWNFFLHFSLCIPSSDDLEVTVKATLLEACLSLYPYSFLSFISPNNKFSYAYSSCLKVLGSLDPQKVISAQEYPGLNPRTWRPSASWVSCWSRRPPQATPHASFLTPGPDSNVLLLGPQAAREVGGHTQLRYCLGPVFRYTGF